MTPGNLFFGLVYSQLHNYKGSYLVMEWEGFDFGRSQAH